MPDQYGTYGSQESYLALQRIPADEKNRQALESSAALWLQRLEMAKWPYALQWFENASYLLGNHLTRFYYNSDAGFGVTHPSLNGVGGRGDTLVAKTADNRLIRPVETAVGMHTQSRLEPRVVPNSDQPRDEQAADLSEVVLKLFWEHPLGMPRKIDEAMLIKCICGTVAVEIEYGDTDEPVVVPKTKRQKVENPYYNPDEEEDAFNTPEFEQDVPTGGFKFDGWRRDLMARVWTPFHMSVDPAATNEEDMRWVARRSFEDRDWIAKTFAGNQRQGFIHGTPSDVLDNLTSENATKFTMFWWAKFQEIIFSPQYYQHGGGIAPQTFTTSGGYAPNQAILTVIDVKYSEEFPQGRTLVFGGDKLLWHGPARAWSPKYPRRWHPYAFDHWFKMPGKFTGMPLLSELVPLQKKINAIDALVHANRKFMSIGQWKIPRHARVREGAMSGIPGEHLQYTAASGMEGPEKVTHVPLPSELLQERDDLLKGMDQIAASGLVGDQVSASAARAGTMLQFFRNERLRSKAPMLQGHERFLEKIGQNILIDVQLNVEDEDEQLTARIVQAAREHSTLAINSFTGASLRDHHSVKIDVATSMMHSPEALEAKALEFFQYSGGQVTPEERAGIIKAIGLDQFVANAQNASVERARLIVARIVEDPTIDPMPFDGIDDPQAMMETFRVALLSDKALDWDKDVLEKVIGLFDHYAQVVAEQRAAMIREQLQLAQAQKAGPGPEPAAPGNQGGE